MWTIKIDDKYQRGRAIALFIIIIITSIAMSISLTVFRNGLIPTLFIVIDLISIYCFIEILVLYARIEKNPPPQATPPPV